MNSDFTYSKLARWVAIGLGLIVALFPAIFASTDIFALKILYAFIQIAFFAWLLKLWSTASPLWRFLQSLVVSWWMANTSFRHNPLYLVSGPENENYSYPFVIGAALVFCTLFWVIHTITDRYSKTK